MLADKEGVLIRRVQGKEKRKMEKMESGMCEWAQGDGYQAVPKGFVLYSCLFQEAPSTVTLVCGLNTASVTLDMHDKVHMHLSLENRTALNSCTCLFICSLHNNGFYFLLFFPVSLSYPSILV